MNEYVDYKNIDKAEESDRQNVRESNDIDISSFILSRRDYDRVLWKYLMESLKNGTQVDIWINFGDVVHRWYRFVVTSCGIMVIGCNPVLDDDNRADIEAICGPSIVDVRQFFQPMDLSQVIREVYDDWVWTEWAESIYTKFIYEGIPLNQGCKPGGCYRGFLVTPCPLEQPDSSRYGHIRNADDWFEVNRPLVEFFYKKNVGMIVPPIFSGDEPLVDDEVKEDVELKPIDPSSDEYEEDPVEEDEETYSEQMWGEIPQTYTAYVDNVGILLPNGWAIDQQATAFYYDELKRNGYSDFDYQSGEFVLRHYVLLSAQYSTDEFVAQMRNVGMGEYELGRVWEEVTEKMRIIFPRVRVFGRQIVPVETYAEALAWYTRTKYHEEWRDFTYQSYDIDKPSYQITAAHMLGSVLLGILTGGLWTGYEVFSHIMGETSMGTELLYPLLSGDVYYILVDQEKYVDWIERLQVYGVINVDRVSPNG